MYMTRALACGLALALLILPLGTHAETSLRPDTGSSRPEIAVPGPNVIIHGGSPTSQKDTQLWNIYGGTHPDGLNDRTPEGWFNSLGWAPSLQGWTTVDLTEQPPRWHVSTFNASNLDAVAQNHAMFSGVEAGTPGYTTAPGYGNNADDWLDWRIQTNPTVSTTVDISFDYNLDTEANYDFFIVEYDSAGVMRTLASFTGNTRDVDGNWTTPGHYEGTLLYTPLMYNNFEVHLRLRVVSDSGWSDEDGLFPSDGAVQVDNILVRFNGIPVTAFGDGLATMEDLGGGEYDTEGWQALPSNFVGDFARVWPQVLAIDPCRSEPTPQVGFVDDGSSPNNSLEKTSGSVSSTWTYGVEGGWVVNYEGGLTNGVNAMTNEVWSPEILWDDPSSGLDDGIQGGAFLEYQVWQHLPLLNGIFHVWHVRSFPDELGNWSSWSDRNFVYYGENPVYNNVRVDVSDLLVPGIEKVQIALGVNDLSDVFGFPGIDATPSPFFDNVSFWKYDATGPAFTTRNIDLFQDGFSNSGVNDWQGNAALASVRLDAALDINPAGIANVAGDSIVVDVVAVNPGTTLDGPGSNGLPVMRWVLDANPAFDAVRIMPPGAVMMGTSSRGFNLWMGTVEGDSARTSSGVTVQNRFFFDGPNDGPGTQPQHSNEDAMFFPGDLFRWFLEARDTAGETSFLPADTTGFYAGDVYARTFTVRALPTVVPDGVGGLKQPSILVVNDFGRRGGEAELGSAMIQNGLIEGVDYDTYTVMGPSSLVGNGIGSSGVHGANAAQLMGYDTIIYLSENLSSGLISDGSDVSGNDKSNDVGVLSDWHQQAGDRNAVYFGDNIGSGLVAQGATAQTYLNVVMGVDAVGSDVRDDIGGQTAPYVASTGSLSGSFASGFVAYGGCLSINSFDHIQALNGSGALTTHAFTDGGPTGGLLSPAASVWYERTEQVNTETYKRVDLTFPFGFTYVTDYYNKIGPGVSARSVLLGEILTALGKPTSPGGVTGGDSAVSRQLLVEQNHPNPFNPSTTIRFTAPQRGQVTVKVYNVRGETVATIFEGTVEAGATTAVTWNGRDALGSPVSSGVYLYQVQGMGLRETRKMALIK